MTTPRVVPANDEDWAHGVPLAWTSRRHRQLAPRGARHIRSWSSGHTEAIITASLDAPRAFVSRVRQRGVMINASTRFTDGEQFGLGAEIGICTQKLHARGPMGLRGADLDEVGHHR